MKLKVVDGLLVIESFENRVLLNANRNKKTPVYRPTAQDLMPYLQAEEVEEEKKKEEAAGLEAEEKEKKSKEKRNDRDGNGITSKASINSSESNSRSPNKELT